MTVRDHLNDRFEVANLADRDATHGRTIGVTSRTSTAILLLTLLPGCTSLHRLYVHDATAEQASTAAATIWKSAVPTSILNEESAYFAKLSADEVVNAKLEIASQRDLQLVQFVDGLDVSTSLKSRLNDLTGSSDYATFAPLKARLADDDFSIQTATSVVNTWLNQLTSDGYHSPLPTCDTIPSPSASTTDDQRVDLASLATACASLAAKQKTFDTDFAAYGNKGKIGDTITQLTSLQSNLQSQQSKEAALQKMLTTLTKQVNSAQAGSSLAQTAANDLRFCLADPSSDADKAAASQPGLAQELSDCAVKAGQTLDPLVKQLKHTALRDEIQSVLSSLLNANASSVENSGTAPIPSIAASTTEALRTVSSLSDAASAITEGRQPSVNALLLALAYEQYQADIDSAEVASLKQHIALYKRMLDGYEAEASFIAQALQELAKPTKPAHQRKAADYRDEGRVLAYVNASWNLGAYPVALSEYAEDDLVRADSLRVASIVVAGWQSTLQPAFDELSAYGKGGLDAQTMSNLAIALINAGGFAAVAHGVNK